MKATKRKGNEANGTHNLKDKKAKQKKSDRIGGESLLGKYLEESDFKSRFSEAFRRNEPLNESGAIIYNKPFTCCFLPNFISDEEFLSDLKQELLQLNFHQKSNDLYKFNQSDDLKKASKPQVTSLRKALYQEFRTWLEDVTELKLTDQVDMSCARYEHTDVLLCHDDELEGRRIAYVLYLVPPWEARDGGSLDLFSVDEHGQPDSIVETLVPQWNSLVFFEVTPVSFHQVAEVLSQDKTRLSISGWFHGDPPKRPAPYKEPCPSTVPPKAMENERLVEWINPIYLDEGVVTDIRDRFEEESEIELQDFLLDDKYAEVIETLRSKDTKWTRIGPPNKRPSGKCTSSTEQIVAPYARNYEHACSGTLPVVLSDLMDLLQSAPMFKLLRTLTGLDLADTALTSEEKDDGESGGKRSSTLSPGNPRCLGDIRRWSHGSYTLVHDTDPERADYALDAMLYCGCEGWDSDEYGGFTSYLASGEDEELLSVHPLANSLALVYRDMETLKFVKHINHKSIDTAGTSRVNQDFCDIHLVYYE